MADDNHDHDLSSYARAALRAIGDTATRADRNFAFCLAVEELRAAGLVQRMESGSLYHLVRTNRVKA